MQIVIAVAMAVVISTTPVQTDYLDIELSNELQDHVFSLSDEYEVDPYTVLAILYNESRFIDGLDNYNTNGTVDRGLAQINSCNWEWFADMGIDVHTPEGNIEACFYLLNYYRDKGYSEYDALRCYARGEGGVSQGKGYSYANEIYRIKKELFE